MCSFHNLITYCLAKNTIHQAGRIASPQIVLLTRESDFASLTPCLLVFLPVLSLCGR